MHDTTSTTVVDPTAVDQLAHRAEQLGWRATRDDRPDGRALLVLTRDDPSFDTWPSIHVWFDAGWFDRGYLYSRSIDPDLVTTVPSLVDIWVAS
jgi:hypothetical protein